MSSLGWVHTTFAVLALIFGAAVAEVAARNPQTGEFVGAGAAIATVVVIAGGTLLIGRYLPGAMRATPSRFQRGS